MNKPLNAMVSRAEVEDFLYHEADLLDSWRLDDWLALCTEDVNYFVPPNDKPDADHRFALFTIADDAVRLRERIIRLKDPNCHAEFPPSRTRRFITNVRITGAEGETLSVAANSRSSATAATSRRASSSAATATSSGAATARSDRRARRHPRCGGTGSAGSVSFLLENRHARPCAGHPRLGFNKAEDYGWPGQARP